MGCVPATRRHNWIALLLLSPSVSASCNSKQPWPYSSCSPLPDDTDAYPGRFTRCLNESVAAYERARADGSLFDGCKLMWHIHTPRTGGTSVHYLLSQRQWRRRISTSGRFTRFNYMSRGAFLNGHWFQIVNTLDEVAQDGGKPLWYSEEIALPDIVHQGYPFLNETCFLAVVRHPEEWFRSCEAFMKMQSLGNIFRYNLKLETKGEWAGVPVMALSKQGYFGPASRDGNVQTHSAAEGTAGFRRLFVAALPAVSDFLATFTTVARGEEPPKVVPHANQAPSQLRLNHSDSNAMVVREFIAQKFALDWRAWRTLSESRLGVGMFTARGQMACDADG